MKKMWVFIAVLLMLVMPLAFAGGGRQADTESRGRIAVIRNMENSDHTAQFFAGAVAEGRSFGYTVDTFMSDGDDIRMQDLMERALLQNYDIWVVSHANAGYQHNFLSRAVRQGVSVAAFDSGGERVPGATYTSQDDASLAAISLDAIINKALTNGARLPIKIIPINILGFIVPFDNRQAVIDEYVRQGRIEVLQQIALTPGSDYFTATSTAIRAALTRYPPGEIHGIWSATSFFLDGVIDAVQGARRSDVILTAVDVSDTEIRRLVDVPQYHAIAAVDPYVIGMVMVRIAVARKNGLPVPNTLQFPAVAITADMLNRNDSMATLSNYFSDFGSSDLMMTPELRALKR